MIVLPDIRIFVCCMERAKDELLSSYVKLCQRVAEGKLEEILEEFEKRKMARKAGLEPPFPLREPFVQFVLLANFQMCGVHPRGTVRTQKEKPSELNTIKNVLGDAGAAKTIERLSRLAPRTTLHTRCSGHSNDDP